MAAWKNTVIQILLTIVITMTVMKLLAPGSETLDRIKEIEKRLGEVADEQARISNSLTDLGQRDSVLKSIDSRVAKLESALPPGLDVSAPHQREARAAKPDLSRKMPDSPDRMPPLSPPRGLDWMTDLSPEQREEVNSIFREHAARLPELVTPPKQGVVANPEEVREAFLNDLEELKERMKNILNKEQYDKFLESLNPLERASPAQTAGTASPPN
jgi:predicted transcriptional regulator